MIKSQDELNPCNDGKRSSDVLVATIEKLEQTQKQLDIAVECLEVIATHTCCYDEDVKSQLSIVYDWSCKTLEQIKELNNDKAN